MEIHICETCGKETENETVLELISGKKLLIHRCAECDAELERQIEWENAQYRETDAICPWCGYTFEPDENPYEEGTNRIACPLCGKPIECESEISWSFTTRKPMDMYEPDN